MKALLGNSEKRIEINFEGVDIKETDNLQEKYQVIFLKGLNNTYREDIAYVYDKNKKKYAAYSFIRGKFILPFDFSDLAIASYSDGYFGEAFIAVKSYKAYIEMGLYSFTGKCLFPMTKNVYIRDTIKALRLRGKEFLRYAEIRNLTNESVQEALNNNPEKTRNGLCEFLAPLGENIKLVEQGRVKDLTYNKIKEDTKYNAVGIYSIEKQQYTIPMQKVSDVYISVLNILTRKDLHKKVVIGDNYKYYESVAEFISECGKDHGYYTKHKEWIYNYFFEIRYIKDGTCALYSREGKLIVPAYIYENIVICKKGIKAVKRTKIRNNVEQYVIDSVFRGYEPWRPHNEVYEDIYDYKNHYIHRRYFDVYSFDGELLSENNIEEYEDSTINYNCYGGEIEC